MKKVCFRCGIEKDVSEFHKHSGMRDGRLNKCGKCVADDVRKWRSEQPKGERTRRYLRELELGSRTRVAPQKYGKDPIARKFAVEKYRVKRRTQVRILSEFDDFVFKECIRLNIQRKTITGFSWHVDHIIPLNHKFACGLHVAANLQSVPGSWNERKSNKTMNSFWPICMGY